MQKRPDIHNSALTLRLATILTAVLFLLLCSSFTAFASQSSYSANNQNDSTEVPSADATEDASEVSLDYITLSPISKLEDIDIVFNNISDVIALIVQNNSTLNSSSSTDDSNSSSNSNSQDQSTQSTRELSVSWDQSMSEIVYSGNPVSITPVLGNIAEGDDVTAIVEEGDEVLPGIYSAKIVSLDGEDADKYSLPDSGLEFAYEIVQAEPEFVSAETVELVYGQSLDQATDLEAVFNDVDGKQLSGTVKLSDDQDLSWVPDAGSYEDSVELVFSPDDSAYTTVCFTATLEVSPRPLAVSIANITTTYGDPFPDSGVIELDVVEDDPNSGPLYGDTAEDLGLTVVYGINGLEISNYLSSDQTSELNDTAAGHYVLKLDDAQINQNYSVSQTVLGSWTVEPKTVGLGWSNTYARQISDGLDDPVAYATGLIIGSDGELDDVQVSTSSPVQLVANDDDSGDNSSENDSSGVYEILASELTGEDASNYSLPENTSCVYGLRSANAQAMFPKYAQITYGDSLASEGIFKSGSGNGSFSWLTDSDILVTNSDGETSTYSPDDVLPVGTYTLSGSMIFTSVSSTDDTTSTEATLSAEVSIELHVTAMPLSLQISNATSIYGDELPEITAEVISGSLVGDDQALDLLDISIFNENGEEVDLSSYDNESKDGQSYNSAPAGSYTLTANPTDEALENYEITVLDGSLEIEPRTVEIAWSGFTEDDGTALVYDGTAKEVVASVSNLLPDDNVIVSLQGGDSIDAGSYVAVVTGLEDDTESAGTASNYALPQTGSSETESLVLSYTIEKADPVVEFPSGGLIVSGNQLSTASFSFEGSANVDGNFWFVSPKQVLEDGTVQVLMSFVPSDSNNISSVVGLASITAVEETEDENSDKESTEVATEAVSYVNPDATGGITTISDPADLAQTSASATNQTVLIAVLVAATVTVLYIAYVKHSIYKHQKFSEFSNYF